MKALSVYHLIPELSTQLIAALKKRFHWSSNAFLLSKAAREYLRMRRNPGRRSVQYIYWSIILFIPGHLFYLIIPWYKKRHSGFSKLSSISRGLNWYCMQCVESSESGGEPKREKILSRYWLVKSKIPSLQGMLNDQVGHAGFEPAAKRLWVACTVHSLKQETARKRNFCDLPGIWIPNLMIESRTGICPSCIDGGINSIKLHMIIQAF